MDAKLKSTILAAAIASLFAAQPALADPVVVDGASYTLTYSGSALPDLDPLHETFRVTLGIDTNTYSGGGSFLDGVAIKVSSDVTSASLFSAPGGTGSWSLLAGGLNSSGCSGSGSGWVCADGLANSGKGLAITTGNGAGIDYSFAFDVTMNNGSLFTGIDAASIKALYVNTAGNHIGAIVSQPITLAAPVPEPETYAMMLAGLGLMGFVARRRKQVQELA